MSRTFEMMDQLDELRPTGHISEKEFNEEMATLVGLLGGFTESFSQLRISNGKAAASMNKLTKSPKAYFSGSATTLHKKAVERRRKRKKGGPK